ncbi:GNAT family N-acetyltransferase [Micromonospora zamorensis]|uniref:GNAT family N-acetyltransferase n=1 Tax=Micromonospora zamorensis TaxID=709883 RepID=UPI003795BDDA
MIEGLQLRHHNADEAKGILDQLVGLYLEVYAGGGEFHSEDRFRRQLSMHMQRVGWELVTATVDGALVGYIYGFPLPSQTRWWDGIHQPAPPGFTDEDGRRTFALSELLVRPNWRRQGIAAALHDDLVGGRTEPRATLLVRPDNVAAQRAYRSWGWSSVTKLRPSWEAAPTFDVFVRSAHIVEPKGLHVGAAPSHPRQLPFEDDGS